MRAAVIALAGLALIAGCSKKPAAPPPAAQGTPAAAPGGAPASPSASPDATTPTPPAASGPALAGSFVGDGKPVTLTQVTAHVGEPFDGKPITVLVFSAQDQAGDAKADFNAMFGKFGDAIVVHAEPDGTVIGTEVMHSGLKRPGSVSISGPIVLKDYQNAGGQISGHLTSNGPVDVFDDKIEVDLTFHTKAP